VIRSRYVLNELAASLTGEVHDLYIWVDEIVKDEDSGELLIPLRVRKRDAPSRVLVFKGVESYEIQDTERIGRYDLNRVVFDRDGRTATVLGNIPFRIIVRSNQLEATSVDPLPSESE